MVDVLGKSLVDFGPLIENKKKQRKVENVLLKSFICTCTIIKKSLKKLYAKIPVFIRYRMYAWVSDNRKLCLGLKNGIFTLKNPFSSLSH